MLPSAPVRRGGRQASGSETIAPGPSPAELAYLRPARTCPSPQRRLEGVRPADWRARLAAGRGRGNPRSRGPLRGPLGRRPNLPRRPGTGPSSMGPPYLVMAQSEVRGGDAGESNPAECACDR